ncbi:MAG: site-specific integrase [Pyrinomonadaceae bacterium]
MARERKGAVITRGSDIYARLRFVDDTGKTKSMEWKAKNRSMAKDLLKVKIRELDDSGPKAIQLERMTFADLADEYKTRKLIPAKYVTTAQKTTKIAGLRSLQGPLLWIETLKSHFGRMKLRSITYAALEDYKLLRFSTQTIGKTQRSISSVNREMALLRSMLRFAVRERMITTSPFAAGAPLISHSDENRRERVLSYDEERRLLTACTELQSRTYERKGRQVDAQDKKSRRLILKSVIIVALDTAMRRGELLTLKWSDVDLVTRQINLLAFNTKTAKSRSVGMTPRVYDELQQLYKKARKDPDDLVFGIADNFKRSFSGARDDADIEGLTFHDLRHTAITRMVQAGLPAPEIMKISGHTQMVTFQRYVNPDGLAVQNIAEKLAAHNAQQTAPAQVEAAAVGYVN